MTIIGDAFIAVKPDPAGFGPQTEKQVLSSVTSIAKKAAVTLGGVFAAQKAGDFLVGAVNDAREANKINRQTEAVIKSTGGVANVSLAEIEKLNSAIQATTGISDDAVNEGQNLLLTFTNIRNEAGKGNDVFNRATTSLVDMAAAMGQDPKNAAIQLGKALNDPIAGISSLGRAGVQFTDQQKEQIKWLVENGRTMDAQKIILKELETQFGGSAAAQADSTKILGAALADVKEEIGMALLPIVEKAASFFARNLPGALDAARGAFATVADVVQNRVVPIVRTVWDAFSNLFGFLERNRPVLAGIAAAMLVAVVPALIAKTTAVWASVAAWTAQAAAVIAANAPFVALAAVIGALVAGVIWAYQNVDIFRGAVDAVASFLTDTVWPIIKEGARLFVDVLVPAIVRVVEFYFKLYAAVARTMADVAGTVAEKVGVVLEWFGSIVTKIGEVVSSVGTKVGEIVGFFTGLPDRLARAGAGMFDWIKRAFESAINAVIRGWNRLEFKIPGFDPPGPGPKFGGFTLGLPDIPLVNFAQGGLIRGRPGQGILARIGEATRPTNEAVLPLPDAVVNGLARIADGGFGETVQLVMPAGIGERNAVAVAVASVRELRADKWRRGL